MPRAYRVADIRAAEAEVMARVPPGSLMAVAARGLALAVKAWLSARGIRLPEASVVVLAGAGNNGGDALYAGEFLARRGATVTAVALSDAVHPGGAAALQDAGGRVLRLGSGTSAVAAPQLGQAHAAVASAQVVLDGIVGLGGSGALRPPADSLVQAGAGRIVAVDLPSGVNPDTGVVSSADAAVQAELTVTFGVLKPALVLPAGRWRAGEVRLIDIGLDAPLLNVEAEVVDMDAATAARQVPRPGRSDDKYTRGVVGVVAGSQDYPGAGVLCTGAARLGGAGMVRYAGAAPTEVITRWPEVVPSFGDSATTSKVQAWIVGPGAGQDERALRRLEQVLASDVPVLIDADAITLIARHAQVRALARARCAPTLFTPHAGEFARLGGDLGHPEGILAAVRALAAELKSVVLLKGSATVVADADRAAAVAAGGPPELATAGSGDVLSGLVGSMLAAGNARAAHTLTAAEVVTIAAAGAYLHGLAGQRAAAGGRPIAADDVLGQLPGAVAEVRRWGH